MASRVLVYLFIPLSHFLLTETVGSTFGEKTSEQYSGTVSEPSFRHHLFPNPSDMLTRRELALGITMCIFVTISEKRGIVYTEHMLVVAAAAVEAKGSADPRTWVDAGQSGSRRRSAVCVLGTCKAAHVKIQTPSKGG